MPMLKTEFKHIYDFEGPPKATSTHFTVNKKKVRWKRDSVDGNSSCQFLELFAGFTTCIKSQF